MTTTTVSLDGLRDLAGFRAENGCAVSLYVDLDPALSPTTRDTTTRVHAMLDAAAKSHGATRPDLSHEVRAGLKSDLERLAEYFEEEFDRDGAHGLAVFTASLDNVWRVLALPWKVADAARVSDDFLLSPLVPLIGRGNGVIVAVVGREQGRLLALRGGRIVAVADRTEETQGRHDQGGRSQARYQRHIGNLDLEHYKIVAEELERRFRALGRPRLVVVAGDETRAEFADVLSSELEEAVIGWTSADAHASDSELGEIVQPFVDEWRAGQEEDVVERWGEEVGKNALGASGWAETLEAASDGRIEVLLHQAGVQRDAYRCPACSRAAAVATTCPLDGTTMEHRDDGLDLAVRLTLAYGGDLLAVTRRQDLDPVEGIGAILRF
ncbi:MAG: Vms1/Ankzf1 family peptidyl-tRNA hydrolase [Gaiellaceae bacterium]